MAAAAETVGEVHSDPSFGSGPREIMRAEIDTSAPIESVKEAANRFGGIGFWRPNKPASASGAAADASQDGGEMLDIAKVEEQAALLEQDLIVKERETLEVLKELENTKMVVEELKLKLQKEASEVNAVLGATSDDKNGKSDAEVAEKEKNDANGSSIQSANCGLDMCPSAAPGYILLELKQAKLNLTKTTSDLNDIRAIVDSYNKKLEKERVSLEKTRQRLSSNTSKISSLEEELNQTRQKLQAGLDNEGETKHNDPVDITRELQRLGSEVEQFKKVGEDARSEVLRALTEIEQTRTRIKTAEIRLVAAKKMKEAARATEAVARAEIKALTDSETPSAASQQKPEGVTLTFEEYSSLTTKAREAEEANKKRVVDAMLQVDEANLSKTEILKKVEEATEEVKISKKALEEALSRVEAANKGKLAVEEAMRKWRSDGQRRRSSVHHSARFKNSYPSHHRKDSRLFDVNGLNLGNDELKPVLKPALSIGQILSRKLLLQEDFENGTQEEVNPGKGKISLAQMLNKTGVDLRSARKFEIENGDKQLPAKRKKFGLSRISLLVTKQSKKKKKQAASLSSRL